MKRNLLKNRVSRTQTSTPVDTEMIQFFVQLSRTIGQRPSVGEIYGLLFISPKPLTFDDLIERLQLSNGAASEGLKYLRDLGAVRVVAVEGARRTHYEAMAELRNLAGLFLRRRLEPHLSEGKARLEQIGEKAERLQGEAREHILARIKLLQSWEENASRILPFLLDALGSQ